MSTAAAKSKPQSKNWTVTKRDGRKEAFDPEKIKKALGKCYVNGLKKSLGEVQEIIDRTAVRVVNYLSAQKIKEPTVEDTQRAIITQLWSEGEYEAAEHYTLYREERRKARESRPIPPEVWQAIEEDSKHFPTPLQYYQFISKFARWREEDSRRETWRECNARVFGWFSTLPCWKFLSSQEVGWLRGMMYDLKASPAMRVVQMAGPALERCHVGAYNCAYHPIQDLFAFAELLYILMQGTGAGFSVEVDYVGQLPRVQRQRKPAVMHEYVVEDDTEGWCNGLLFGLNKWFAGEDVEYKLHKVREAGARLKTKGGRASGPGPLRELLAFARKVVLGAQGRHLSDLEVHDICCMIGKIVQVGGVRRSSCISLSDLESILMRQAKHGNWWLANVQRSMANNSAVYNEPPPVEVFMEEWLALVKSKSGERGIFNRNAVWEMIPKRRSKKHRFGCNPCLTGETLVYTADGRGGVPIRKLAEEGSDVPVFCLDNAGKIDVRWMRNPRLTGHRKPIYKITLDNGKSIRVTGNHKFRLRNGSYIEASLLKSGDSLSTTTQVPDFGGGYVFVEGPRNRDYEHRFVAQFHCGREILESEHVHHKNEIKNDNRPGNLEITPAAEHLSKHGEGEENPRYCGYTNEELLLLGRRLVRSLGRRFSSDEWCEFARENKLPLSFSNWRRKTLGNQKTFAKRCALLEGLEEHSDADPRVVRSYWKILESGLDAEIVDGELFVRKECEVCREEYTVRYRKREQGYCSYSCSSRAVGSQESVKAKREASRSKTIKRRRELWKEQQIEVYLRLAKELGREPLKKEWQNFCKLVGVSTEMSRSCSPFRYWEDLKRAAELFNHKVVSVEPDGHEDVYNGTVDEFHNFFSGGFEEQSRNGSRKIVWLNNRQCGEIVLRPYQFCNLTISIFRSTDTEEDMVEKVKAATYFGVVQSCATKFNYIRQEWSRNCEEERLLGVDIMGHMDHPLLRPGVPGREQLVKRLKKAVADTAKELSTRFGINYSAANTCLKPGGDSSEFFDTIPLAPDYGKYKIRRTREAIHTPVCKFLKDAGVPHEPAAEDEAGLVAFAWPKKAPEGRITRHDMTAIEQLENWLFWQTNWAEHSCSVTIYVKEHEWPEVGTWVWKHFDRITGLTFFPWDNGTHRTAPHEEISVERYEKLAAEFPKIDWAKLIRYEDTDQTTGSQTYACAGGACEV